MIYTVENTDRGCTILVDGAAMSKVVEADTYNNVAIVYPANLPVSNDGNFLTVKIEAKDVQVVGPNETRKWLAENRNRRFFHGTDAYRLRHFEANGSKVSAVLENMSGSLPPEDHFSGEFVDLMTKYRLEMV